MSDAPDLDLGFLAEGAGARAATVRRRARSALGVSAGVTLTWAVAVTAGGHWPRVVDHWAASVTMVFGSFVGGATPQGGGAIAFPVFTKVLEVPAEVARSFSLSIQTVGMGTAAVAILVTRRRLERTAVLVGVPSALTGFLVMLLVFGDRDAAFWPSRLPGAYVKVTFTIVLAAMALVVYLGMRVRVRAVEPEFRRRNRRVVAALVVAGLLGGGVSALVGSGADVLVYLVVVVLLGIDPKVGVPTSVVVMAAVSVAGLVVLGIGDGQLDVALSPDRTEVVTVGGEAVAGDDGTPLAASRHDLFGLWLAAVPVVAWGGPAGSAFAARLRPRALLTFVVVLASAEVLSTVLFLTELRTDRGLLAYALVGLAGSAAGLIALTSVRRRLFGLPGVDPERSLSRADLDVVPGFETDLDGPPGDRSTS